MKPMTRIIVNSNLIEEIELGGEVLLMNTGTEEILSMEGVSSSIWRIITKKNCTSEELVKELIEEYDVSVDDLRSDLTNFLELMCKKDLIRLE